MRCDTDGHIKKVDRILSDAALSFLYGYHWQKPSYLLCPVLPVVEPSGCRLESDLPVDVVSKHAPLHDAVAWCCCLFIVSHLICFYAVNDYTWCSTYVLSQGRCLREPEANSNRRVIGCMKNTQHRAVSLRQLHCTALVLSSVAFIHPWIQRTIMIAFLLVR